MIFTHPNMAEQYFWYLVVLSKTAFRSKVKGQGASGPWVGGRRWGGRNGFPSSGCTSISCKAKISACVKAEFPFFLKHLIKIKDRMTFLALAANNIRLTLGKIQIAFRSLTLSNTCTCS